MPIYTQLVIMIVSFRVHGKARDVIVSLSQFIDFLIRFRSGGIPHLLPAGRFTRARYS